VITDQKILVTGASGTIGRPLACQLAQDNEVWGAARFVTGDGRRRELETAGVRIVRVDLGRGDLGELPDDFTLVLHMAWMRADLAQLDDAIRTNVEGAGLVLHHCRKARAALVMSGMGVYAPSDDPWHPYRETDPVGRAATAFAPTSPACKLGVESVARFCARAFDLPVTIARLNTFMGTPDSFPGMHIDAVLAGKEIVAPYDPSPHNPINLDDMRWQLEPLLDAASPVACITNWCGDDVTTAQEWVRDAATWSGREGRLRVQPVSCSPAGCLADPSKRMTITGPCRTRFPDAFRALYDTMARKDRLETTP